MHLGSDTDHFFAVEEDPSSPMLELANKRNRTDLYEKEMSAGTSPSRSATWRARWQGSRRRG
jgi:hypothetical protein